MTNAELIETLRYCFEKRKTVVGVPWYVWCDRVADALEAADEKIADCIAAIDALDDSNDAYIKENERLKKRIAELEAQIPKEGEWIKHGCEEEQFEYYECPLCGFIGLNYHYCPNCGAKMDGERKDGAE